jgi:hypothetical protein
MTPARLQVLLDVEVAIHTRSKTRKPAPSKNPAADLAMLANL